VTAAGGAISVLVGVVLLRLTLTGTYQRYVREEMAPFLAVAGVFVVVVGVVTLVQAIRRVPPVDAHDHHEHGHGVAVGWLLLAPIAALLLVAPPTLGSYGVDRAARVEVRAGAGVLEPLVPGGEPHAMSLVEFGQRAAENEGESFNGATVRLSRRHVGRPAGPRRVGHGDRDVRAWRRGARAAPGDERRSDPGAGRPVRVAPTHRSPDAGKHRRGPTVRAARG
jgi:hypothetical protein